MSFGLAFGLSALIIMHAILVKSDKLPVQIFAVGFFTLGAAFWMNLGV